MEYFIICLAALIGSGLTLFSGFGLGTLLVPVFALFFPIDTAILLTAVVHFLNNGLKFGLLYQHVNWSIILRFGIPAFLMAYVGASVLELMGTLPEMTHYTIGSRSFTVEWLHVIIGLLLIVFALFELIPAFSKWQVHRKYLPLGGLISGFFGGLSGHQGALRSVFLLRSGLSKEAFIATGVVIACLVDISRLSHYIPQLIKKGASLDYLLLGAATLSAFTGVWLGNKLLKKMTIRSLQLLVSVLLIVFGLALIAGWV